VKFSNHYKPAAIPGVGDEHDMRALGLELFDHMIDFGADDALLVGRRGLPVKAREAVRLGSLDVLGLPDAMSGDRQPQSRSPRPETRIVTRWIEGRSKQL
jgi:hypothetical protein